MLHQQLHLFHQTCNSIVNLVCQLTNDYSTAVRLSNILSYIFLLSGESSIEWYSIGEDSYLNYTEISIAMYIDLQY